MMDVQNVLHMNVGTGASSYAKNSFLQETVIRKSWPVLEQTIKKMKLNDCKFPKCFKIADLGCSSGPNTFLVLSKIIDTVNSLYQENHCEAPEFHVCLNDLPNNDFNTIFKSFLPTFYAELERKNGEKFGPCLISGVPGSFYGRLFPKESIHLVHSSYSLHFLSRVPEGIENNLGAVCMAKRSPLNVFDAYLKQYQKDFSTFLKLRSEEIMPKGHMVLTFIGRSIADPTSKDTCYIFELLAKSLLDLVTEGMIREEEVDSFNLPIYHPYKDEVVEIINREGSFRVDRLDTFQMNWDVEDNEDNKHFVFDKFVSGKNVAKTIRAVTEPMLTSHFENKILDKVFERYATYVSEHLSNYEEKTKFFNIVVSMTKK